MAFLPAAKEEVLVRRRFFVPAVWRQRVSAWPLREISARACAMVQYRWAKLELCVPGARADCARPVRAGLSSAWPVFPVTRKRTGLPGLGAPASGESWPRVDRYTDRTLAAT